MHDITLALRSFRRKPAFTLLVLGVMSLAIGATTAIFSVVNAVLLRPLPFKDPGKLTIITSRNLRLSETAGGAVSFDDLDDFRSRNNAYADIAGTTVRWSFTIASKNGAEQVSGLWASENFFRTLGVAPMTGRTFVPAEDRIGGPAVAVLSSEFARRRFGSEQASLGQTISLDGRGYSITGVMPPDFLLIDESAFWLPLQQNPFRTRGRGVRILNAVGRLKPSFTAQQASADVQKIAKQLEEDYPQTNKGITAEARPLHDHITGNARTSLIVLFGAVGFVFLIAVTNVACLLLLRVTERQRDMALRLALGAGRRRIVSQFLSESAVLSVTAALAGVYIARWSIPVLLAMGPALPRINPIAVDGAALLFTVLLSALTAVVFGILPALQITTANLHDRLKGTGPSLVSSPVRHRFRNAMVVGEIALAVVLLVASGLMIRSFVRLMQVDPGYRTSNTILVTIDVPRSKYPQAQDRLSLYFQVEDRLKALPGVQAVGAVSRFPLSSVIGANNVTSRFEIEGRSVAAGDEPEADYRIASTDYFEAMGIPLSRGRKFTRQDSTDVAIINQAMAAKFWPDGDAIGKRINFGNPTQTPWTTIVGIAGNVRHLGLDTPPRAEVYRPYANNPLTGPMIAVHTTLAADSIVPSIRSAIRSIEKDVPIEINPFGRIVELSTASRRFSMLLLGLFAGVAVLLAVIGVYGVISHSVSQRTREIGLRLALGARPAQISTLILREGLILTAIGAVLGIAGAAAVTRVMRSLLFEVTATDLPTFAAVSVILTLVSQIACYIPARRAAKVEPTAALRFE